MNKNKSKNVKYVIYTRSLNNDGSRGEQLSELHSLVKKEELKVVAECSDTGGAKVPYVREGFDEMIKIIQTGKADGILCTKLDRLVRNPVEGALLRYFLQQGIIKNIRSSDRDWYPEENVVMTAIEFSVASQYSIDQKRKTNDS